MQNIKRTLLALAFLAVIVFCAIIIADQVGKFWRIDLTENNLYTLSEGTREVIAELNQPLNLKLYYARTAALKGPESLRFYNNYYFYIRDLLGEYEKISKGKIRLNIIDPRPDTDDELDAVRYGLKKFSTGADPFFFGLAVVSEFGQEAVIPFFMPERQDLVEYEVSSALYNAATKAKKRIGVISGTLPVFGMGLSPYMAQMMRMQGKEPQEEWFMISQLKKQYELWPIGPDAKEIEPVDLLMVIHPKGLPSNLLFAIDQYLMKGGKLMVFTDPYCISDPAEQYFEKRSDLNGLLEKWGVKMAPNTFAADRELGLVVQQSEDAPAKRLLTFINMKGDSFNNDDVITARLEAVRVLFAGVLEPTGTDGIRAEPLLMTTPAGSAIAADPKDAMVYSDPDTIAERYKEKGAPIVVGYKLTGKFKTAFPDGITLPDEKDKKPKKYESVKETQKDTSIVVFSDVDMLCNFVAFQESFFGVTAYGDNVNLILNAMENLSGSQALAMARTKGRFSRPFKVLDEIEAAAEKETSKKVAVVKEEIAKHQSELQALGSQVNEDNASLLQSEAIKKKRDLEERLMLAKRELRELNKDKRVRIESIVAKLKMYNMVAAPSIILVVAIIVFFVRAYKRKKYLGVRHEK